MNKLLFPALLMLVLITPSAQAGYFAFHEDVQDTIEDVLHNRPDDDSDCEDPDDESCDEGERNAESTPYPWENLLELLYLFTR